jgi:putative membrane protein
MTNSQLTSGESRIATMPLRALVFKGSISGVLMGLANLVPGVSAGAVLLATGIFRDFITGIADLSTFTFRTRSIILLGVLGICWTLAVLLGAGPVKQLVVDHRWIMYSLFIGLTLGGVPLVWEPADKKSLAMWIGCIVGFATMAGLGILQMLGFTGSQKQDAAMWTLFLGGLLAAGATVLPGGSGTFVLLLMGLYVPLLGAVDRFKDALSAACAGDVAAVAWTLGPFAIGMGVGLASVSILMKWTLKRFPQATLGVLLGLLCGSVVGLLPFQQGVKPSVGDLVKGRVMTEELLAGLKPDDWPVEFFTPARWQVAVSIVLIVVACWATIRLTKVEQALEASHAGA